MRKREEIQAMLRPLGFGLVVLFSSLSLPSLWAGDTFTSDDWDRQFSQLYAVDALGRALPASAECGPRREGKYVGVFYFLWHGEHDPSGPWDLSKILKEPEPSYGPPGAFHYWAEPELGYYRSSDPYVFEVHAQWLAAARVDTIVVDVTNGHSYLKNVEILCETWSRLRRNGNPTPQIAFLANTDGARVVTELFSGIYQKEEYVDLWFRWLGKPLVLASEEGLDSAVREFFTFRKSWAWSRTPWFGDGRGKWTWLDDTPQAPGLSEEGKVEQISVSVAQHATTSKGRSFSAGHEPSVEDQHPEQGIYFAEQWERALEVDPDFIFITGWNEWVAQRFVKSPSDGRWNRLAGRTLQDGDSVFVDAYSQEFSRDIEPMKGGHGRNYYYQMVDGIRRFKGAAAVEEVPLLRDFVLDGDLAEWIDFVGFRDFEGELLRRDHVGWTEDIRYFHKGGVNDIVASKIACDESHIFVGLECHSEIAGELSGPTFVLQLDGGVGEESNGLGRIEVFVGSEAVRARYFSASGSERELNVAKHGRTLELSMPLSVFEDVEVLGVRWLPVSSRDDPSQRVWCGDASPIADFRYPLRLPAFDSAQFRYRSGFRK